jgi:hypothetical protein
MAADEMAGCRDVTGELTRTPAGSPMHYLYSLRAVDGEHISIERLESGDPSVLKPLFGRGDGPIRGTFSICITGENPTETYDGKTVFRAKLTAFDPGVSK